MIKYMRRGELTGQLYDVSTVGIGMPIRSIAVTKKNERKNITPIDDVFVVDDLMDNPTYTGMTQLPDSTMDINEYNTSRLNTNKIEFSRTNPQLLDRQISSSLQNISAHNTEYINSMSINLYNAIAIKTQSNFCTSPISILSLIVKNDPNINKILSVINTSEIFNEMKMLHHNEFVSRSSVITKLNPIKISKTFTHYEDNENNVIELPMTNSNFNIGFICSKKHNMCKLTPKLLSEYILGLKRSNANVYCPSFRVTNKIELNRVLSSMQLIQNNNVKYSQVTYFESRINAYIKGSTLTEPIDLTENFIFYVRYIPNNVILFIGRVV